MIPTVAANGAPAFGQYKPSDTGSGYDPWALQVLEIEDGKIVEFTFFLDTETMFPLFGLPPRLDPKASVSPMNAISSRSSGEACRTRSLHPRRLSESASRARTSTVAAVGAAPLRSQTSAGIPVLCGPFSTPKLIGGTTDEFPSRLTV